MLKLLGAAWGTIAGVRAALYERGWRTRRRLDRPVISVGALSVGGAGKTPATALLAALLRDGGFRPAILSRGYRRSGSAPLLVSDGAGGGPRVSAARAGDEPFWLASVLPGVPVAVASRREEAAALAVAAATCDVFILDDAFQHLRVARDVDLLVVNPEAPFWQDAPLPAGRLREAPAAAERADAFLLVGRDADADVRTTLERRWNGRPVFALTPRPPACRALADPVPSVAAGDGEPGADVVPLPTGPVFAFAGIARPQRFFDDIAAAGLELRGRRTFPDHHEFDAGDLATVADEARRLGAEALLTTEKDAVRLPNELPALPLHVWQYRLAAAKPDDLVDWLDRQAGLTARRSAA